MVKYTRSKAQKRSRRKSKRKKRSPSKRRKRSPSKRRKRSPSKRRKRSPSKRRKRSLSKRKQRRSPAKRSSSSPRRVKAGQRPITARGADYTHGSCPSLTSGGMSACTSDPNCTWTARGCRAMPGVRKGDLIYQGPLRPAASQVN
jgi:hypothetical protein